MPWIVQTTRPPDGGGWQTEKYVATLDDARDEVIAQIDWSIGVEARHRLDEKQRQTEQRIKELERELRMP